MLHKNFYFFVALGSLIFGDFTVQAGAAEVMAVDLNDPAISAFKQRLQQSTNPANLNAKGQIREFSTIVQRPELQGLKLPVLDLVGQPAFALQHSDKFDSSFSLENNGGFVPASTSVDERDKLWYSITREYQKGVTVTITADLRVQGSANTTAPINSPKDNQPEIIVAPEKSSEGPIGAQINLYRFPNIPYVVDVECDVAQQRLCRSQTFLATIAAKIGLVAVPSQP
jgi:hypothetical protein